MIGQNIRMPLRIAAVLLAVLLGTALSLAGSWQAEAAFRNYSGMTVTADGQGYALISDAGEVYAFGTVAYRANPVGFTGRIVGISVTANGQGYVAVSSAGQVYAYGTVAYRGNPAGFSGSIVGISATANGQGYAAVSSAGQVYAYGTVAYRGNGDPGQGDPRLGARIADRANGELATGFKEVNANNCNPYSGYWKRGSTRCPAGQRSEAWCADFAAYVWQRAGANVDGITAGAASFKVWADRHRTWKNGWADNPRPGDAIVYGGGGHVGIVVAVNSPTSIRVVGGNVSNAVKALWINPRTDRANGGNVLGYASPTT